MSARPPAPTARTLRVLLIEDSAADALLAILRLQAAGYGCQHRCVVNEAEMRAALRAELPDLILSDFTVPGFDGMTALAIARDQAPDVPFIFLSGTIGEERAIEALKCGAIDYVLKGNPKRLVPAVQRALEEAELRRSNRLTEQRVARLTGVLQMLSGINAALVRIQNRDEVMAEACRLATRVGGYRVAMIALTNPSTRMARPVGWSGYDFMDRPEQDFAVADHESGDSSLMGRVIRTGEAMLCEDIHTFPFAIDQRDDLIGAGVRSLACLPLKVDNTPVGSFLFGATTSRIIGPDELSLLEEVADNLSFALQYLNRQDALNFVSYFEPLTSLAKRALFCERLNRLLTPYAETLPKIAVAVVDLTHLRVINDSLGRHAGDRLLQCVADRLKGRYPDTEQLAHLGGGTFAWFNALPDRAATDLHDLHAEIASLFIQPFRVDGRDIVAEVKGGFAFYPDDGRDSSVLLQNAEAALKEAKVSGAKYLQHRLEKNSELARRIGMERRLRVALDQKQFVLHYQPKIALGTGRVVGVEALLRWNDPDNGLSPPATFLSLLESTGLIVEAGSWVLSQAAHDCREWRRRGLPPMRIAVNVAPQQLRRRNIVREVLDSIGDLGRNSAWGIDLEITEGALSGDSSSCVHALRLLKAAGVGVAIDDFGTGFSSLGRLAELPIDTLKIDRSFTSRLPADRRSCTLVSTIIGLARAFEMATVAEGVETQSQLEFLIRAGCDQSQGYLHSRPLARAEFESWLASFTESGGLRGRSAPT
jgi:diguanylate cyclase (GGDEF)-like protein